MCSPSPQECHHISGVCSSSSASSQNPQPAAWFRWQSMRGCWLCIVVTTPPLLLGRPSHHCWCHCCVVSKHNVGVYNGSVSDHIVVCVQRELQGAKYTTLESTCVEDRGLEMWPTTWVLVVRKARIHTHRGRCPRSFSLVASLVGLWPSGTLDPLKPGPSLLNHWPYLLICSVFSIYLLRFLLAVASTGKSAEPDALTVVSIVNDVWICLESSKPDQCHRWLL